ncbi:DUF2057 domain-containing protein [Shewanella intestini]|uniref:DUF2057 domain-containing protein n=1 Tax=Shewanella intestini TaxID=2017544 RepID=A0ABS5I6A0_9GAMM|nr:MULTISPECIES: DUF2057 domain-containing protein [Shewanella]MBR9729555.1 DUF2057 domain-containing protein [Shewanella intestini]MRG35449.1 DUF2057 domain-containing protein [Shewanella sp. XMDDZSB0408]
MKFFAKTSAALIVLLTSSSVLAANLTIPMSFEYLALDGQEIKTNMFTHQADLALTNGEHKIAIRYHDLVEDDFSDSQTFVKSAPFIVTLTVDGDHQYQLQTPNGNNILHPNKFAEKPQILIKRADKGTVNYVVELTNLKENSFIGKLFNGGNSNNFDQLSTQATSNSAATHSTPPVITTSAIAAQTAPTNAVTATKSATHQATKNQSQQMLQYWWQQADEKTKKEFMSWAIKQL